jgi:hypothetical protein
MLRVIRPPLIAAVSVGSDGVLLPPPPGLVGLLLLPQPSITEAIVTNEIA